MKTFSFYNDCQEDYENAVQPPPAKKAKYTAELMCKVREAAAQFGQDFTESSEDSSDCSEDSSDWYNSEAMTGTRTNKTQYHSAGPNAFRKEDEQNNDSQAQYTTEEIMFLMKWKAFEAAQLGEDFTESSEDSSDCSEDSSDCSEDSSVCSEDSSDTSKGSSEEDSSDSERQVLDLSVKFWRPFENSEEIPVNLPEAHWPSEEDSSDSERQVLDLSVKLWRPFENSEEIPVNLPMHLPVDLAADLQELLSQFDDNDPCLRCGEPRWQRYLSRICFDCDNYEPRPEAEMVDSENLDNDPMDQGPVEYPRVGHMYCGAARSEDSEDSKDSEDEHENDSEDEMSSNEESSDEEIGRID
jgi:hypothetical protein